MVGTRTRAKQVPEDEASKPSTSRKPAKNAAKDEPAVTSAATTKTETEGKATPVRKGRRASLAAAAAAAGGEAMEEKLTPKNARAAKLDVTSQLEKLKEEDAITKGRSPRTSARRSIATIPTEEEKVVTPKPRGRPKRVSDIGGAAVVEPKIATPTRQKRLSELVEPETKPASPARGRRVSEVKEAVAKPQTPTRSKRVSELSEAEPKPATPTRRMRASELSEPEAKPATPTRKKRISELSEPEPRPLTPTRKSRRLSGSIPELVDSPATTSLPLKKRRTSIVELVVEKDEAAEMDNADNQENEATEDKMEEPVQPVEQLVLKAIIEEPEDQDKSEPVVTAIEEKIIKIQDKNAKDQGDTTGKVTDHKQKKEEMRVFQKLQNMVLINKIARQKPKSGKFWKEERSQFRALKKDKGQRRTFEERLKLREEKARNNEFASLLIQEKISRKQLMRERIEANKKRKEEKQLKNEVFQVVKNPNKIKKMKKRDLAKRDILGKV